MIFEAIAIAGAVRIEPEPQRDGRGSFARLWSAKEAADRGLAMDVVECSASVNTRAGTLRGLHFQRAPHAEAKLVRCTRGRAWDVAVDLRRSSPTYLRWAAVELDGRSGRSVYLPAGLAHGFLTLEDDTEIHYQISAAYEPASAAGIRWDDAAFAIPWPETPVVLSGRDATFSDFDAETDSL